MPRQGALAKREGHLDREIGRRPARRQQQPHEGNGTVRKGRGDQRARRYAESHNVLTSSMSDGRAPSGEKNMTCGNWTQSGKGAALVGHHANRPARRCPIDVVELVACLSWLRAGCAQIERRRRPALLHRGQVTGSPMEWARAAQWIRSNIYSTMMCRDSATVEAVHRT
jgi:hypothetical protein